MSPRSVLGIAALVLAVAAWFTGNAGIWVAMAAMLLATFAAILSERLFVVAALLVVAVKTFFVDPTLWSMAVLEGAHPRSRAADAYRIFLLALTIAPIIVFAVQRIESKVTDGLIALFALAVFMSLLIAIGWGVPQLPLLIVFAIAIVMAVYDFWREIRNTNKPGDGGPGR